jgi:hypothetical protein
MDREAETHHGRRCSCICGVLGDRIGKIRKCDVREIIGRPVGQYTRYDHVRLVNAMKSLGWKDDKNLRFGGEPETCWYRGEGRLQVIKINVTSADGNRRIVTAYGEDEPL